MSTKPLYVPARNTYEILVLCRKCDNHGLYVNKLEFFSFPVIGSPRFFSWKCQYCLRWTDLKVCSGEKLEDAFSMKIIDLIKKKVKFTKFE